MVSKMIFTMMLGLTIHSALASSESPKSPASPDPMKLNLMSNSARLQELLGENIFYYLRYIQMEKNMLRKFELELRTNIPEEKRLSVEICKLASKLRTALYETQWEFNLVGMDQLERLKLPEPSLVDYFLSTHQQKIEAYNLLMAGKMQEVHKSVSAINGGIAQLIKVYDVNDMQMKKKVLAEVRALYEKITLGQIIAPSQNNGAAAQEEKKEDAGDSQKS